MHNISKTIIAKAQCSHAELLVKKQLINARTISSSSSAAAAGGAPPSDNKGDDEFKSPWQRLKDYVLFRPEVIQATYPKAGFDGKEHSEKTGFRYPAPGSRPGAKVPLVKSEDAIYNIQYYTRDTRRNQEEQKFITATDKGIVTLPEGQVSAGPLAIDHLGSPGNKNPAVLKYDPTGTRSAMSTTYAAMMKEVEKHKPNHLPEPHWTRKDGGLAASAAHNVPQGVPVPIGATYSWKMPHLNNDW